MEYISSFIIKDNIGSSKITNVRFLLKSAIIKLINLNGKVEAAARGLWTEGVLTMIKEIEVH
jgi:hypothetical protein